MRSVLSHGVALRRPKLAPPGHHLHLGIDPKRVGPCLNHILGDHITDLEGRPCPRVEGLRSHRREVIHHEFSQHALPVTQPRGVEDLLLGRLGRKHGEDRVGETLTSHSLRALSPG